ncbi:alpha/beta fold hydrolase [Corynebacterium epidermidicanis]|uniref:alpha/beta fold hydrolase n=1 Tax=Corynebacterium epidermidicanis TaxID=1050174 RepID=UPI00130DE53E|nr:hypothetical protein [Corynebacterium epidermidicanis]
MARSARAVQLAGRRAVALEYNNRGTGGLDRSIAEVTEFAERFSTLDIVGHSMGGLVGLGVAHNLGSRVRTLVGVGACWRGVPNRGWNRYSAVLGQGYRDALLPREPVLPTSTRVVSVVSDADKTVPVSSASLGEVITVPGVHHAHLGNQAEAIVRALGLSS